MKQLCIPEAMDYNRDFLLSDDDTLEDGDPAHHQDTNNTVTGLNNTVTGLQTRVHELQLIDKDQPKAACSLRLPIIRCYGRGKALADIRICRLPKELLALSMCVGPSSNTINQVTFFDALLNHNANGAAKSEKTSRGRGRGQMLAHLTENIDTTVPGNVAKKYKEKENASLLSSEPSAYNADSFKKASRTSTIIMHSDIDLDLVPRYEKRKDYNPKCVEEFPALGVSQTRKNSRKSKEIKEFEPLTSTLEMNTDMIPADGDVTSHRSSESFVLISHTDGSSLGENLPTGQSGQEAMILTDIARDSFVNISSRPSLAGYADEGGELRNMDIKDQTQAEISCIEYSNQNSEKITGMEDASTDKAALAASLPMGHTVAPSSKEAAVKKKGNGGWRLEGPLVVHFEGVPKQHCGKLREMVNQLATIVDEERKNQKGGRSFRFLFESDEDCKYVVSCMNEASDIFDDRTVSPPITCYCLKAKDLSLE